MSGALNMGTHQINNIVDPTSAQDAATKNYVDGKVADSITDGVTTVAPSQNAVFDALALKLDLVGGTLTGDLVLDDEHSVKFTEASPGTDYVEVKAPASVSANYTLTLPPAVAASNGSALVSDTSGNLSYAYIIPDYSGDISRTPFTALDNQSVAANVTGLVFSNAVVRGFKAQVTIVRASTYAEYTLKGIQKGASWEMSQDYVGDDTGLVFSIDSSGQVQYTSTSTGNTAAILFKASTV
jgi:hypothetical protein